MMWKISERQQQCMKALFVFHWFIQKPKSISDSVVPLIEQQVPFDVLLPAGSRTQISPLPGKNCNRQLKLIFFNNMMIKERARSEQIMIQMFGHLTLELSNFCYFSNDQFEFRYFLLIATHPRPIWTLWRLWEPLIYLRHTSNDQESKLQDTG